VGGPAYDLILCIIVCPVYEAGLVSKPLSTVFEGKDPTSPAVESVFKYVIDRTIVGTNVLEKHITSIFRAEVRNGGMYLQFTRPSTQKTNIDILTAMKASNLIQNHRSS
jgi:hypothetical protein